MKKILRICLLLASLMIIQQGFAQGRTVSGKVSNKDGEGIPGVSVFVKGTTTGIVTDNEGKYTLNVPEQAILVFRSLGFISQEITISTQSNINVTLLDDLGELEEIVVNGYREQEKSRITGSISTIESRNIDQVPMASFDQILQGRAPGLLITSASGQPGSSGYVTIRGDASILGETEPLFIVDGVPINRDNFRSINPNDFESVEVLKDASATAIYGSRALNGVILATTKRGKPGRATLNYRTQYGWSIATTDRFNMMNTAEKIEFERFMYEEKGQTNGAAGQLLEDFDNGSISAEERDAGLARLAGINTDWRDILIRTGKTVSHEINTSGGSENGSYYVSANYFSQEGIALRSRLDRYSFRLNLDRKATKDFTFGVNASVNFSESSFIESEEDLNLNNPFAAVYLANPYEQVYDDEGNFLPADDFTLGFNPVQGIEESSSDLEEVKTIASAYLQYNLPWVQGLSVKTTWGVDHIQQNSDRVITPSQQNQSGIPGEAGFATTGFTSSSSFIGTTTLLYNKEITKDHYINAIVGNEVISQTGQSFGYTGYNLSTKVPRPSSITPTSAEVPLIRASNGDGPTARLLSFFADFNYSFRNRYNLQLGVRRDESSRFGDNFKVANFYSIGASWNIEQEDFMSGLDFVDYAKFSVSYGTTGNQEGIGNFAYLSVWSAGDYNDQQALIPGGVANPNLRWETGTKFNTSLDFGVFQNRITGNFTFYNEVTSDLFFQTQLSATVGDASQSQQINVGEMRNRGVEIQVSADIIRTKQFTWNVGFNHTYNDNRIIDIGDEDELELGTTIIRVGEPVNTQYEIGWAGVDPATGQPLYRDLQGNVTPVYSTDFNNVQGVASPPSFGGFSTRLTYGSADIGQIELSAFFSYAYGHRIYNNQRFFLENPNFAGFNLSRNMNDMWKQEGQITDIQSPDFERQSSSKDIEDGSFLRLRNVILAYTLPTSWVSKIKLRSLRVYAQGQNLLTFTRFSGMDPEESNNINQFNYPAARTITFGVDVGF